MQMKNSQRIIVLMHFDEALNLPGKRTNICPALPLLHRFLLFLITHGHFLFFSLLSHTLKWKQLPQLQFLSHWFGGGIHYLWRRLFRVESAGSPCTFQLYIHTWIAIHPFSRPVKHETLFMFNIMFGKELHSICFLLLQSTKERLQQNVWSGLNI